VLPTPRTKIHEVRYVPGVESDILSISTEDGRILFFSGPDPQIPDSSTNGHVPNGKTPSSKEPSLPTCKLIGQLGGAALGISSRIKDYIFLSPHSSSENEDVKPLLLVTAGSDGSIRIWALEKEELVVNEQERDKEKKEIRQLGRLLGTYETANRITCLQAFVMTGDAEAPDVEEEIERGANDGINSESDDSE
jgi:protein MAK11